MYSQQQDHLLKLWEASRMMIQNKNNPNDFLAQYQSQMSPSLSNYEMPSSQMLPFDPNYAVGQQRYDQNLFGMSNPSFVNKTSSWPSLGLLSQQTNCADVHIQNYLQQAIAATEKISNNCNTIASRVQQELAYLNYQLQQESSNGVGLKQNYQFTSGDVPKTTPEIAQQYFMQQNLQQQKYEHQQAQNAQPVSASSITSSPNISNIQLPKIEDHGVFQCESAFSKNFLNLHSPTDSSNVTQRSSSFPNSIYPDGQKLNSQIIKMFDVKSEQPERIQGQNQHTASFKDMHLQGSRISIHVDSVERQQQMDHSLYLSLPSILSKSTSLNHFTSFFSNLPDAGNTERISLGASTEAQLLPYDRLLKQRIVEVQFQKHQQSSKNLENPLLEISSLSFSLLSNIQDILQSSNSSRTLRDTSLVSCLELKPNKKYEVYTHLQKMCETFIRGDKKKRFKERNPQSQYMSQFHNLNRLFFYQVMSIYSYESLSCFEIDPIVSESLRTAVSYIKIHSKLRIEKGNQEDLKNDKKQCLNPKKRCRSEVDDENSSDGGMQLTKKIRNNSQIDKENSNNNLYETEDQFYSTAKSEENVPNDHISSSIPTNNDDDSSNSSFPYHADTGLGKWHIREFKQTFKTVKVENYTHAHYNTLFLKLTPESMAQLKKHSKDIESHWLSFKVDLRKPELIPPEKIIYVNLLKALFYKIFIHFNNVTYESKQTHFDTTMAAFRSAQDSIDDQEAVKLRLNYYHRVVLGIHKLKDGIYMHKF